MNAVDNDVQWVRVATLGEFGQERKLARSVQGIPVLLVRSAGTITAVHNRCTHLGKPLDNGRVMAGQITCPFHGACFDLATGASVAGPAVTPLRIFPVRTVGDEIQIRLDPAIADPA